MKREKKGSPMTLGRIYRQCCRRGDCRIWQGATSQGGYPYVYVPAQRGGGSSGIISGRKVVWGLMNPGMPFPDGGRMVVTCDERLCLFGGHIALSSQAGAIRRAVERGAYATVPRRLAQMARARENSSIKTMEVAESIRERVRSGESMLSVARDLRLHPDTVAKVVHQQTWVNRMAPNASVFHQRA